MTELAPNNGQPVNRLPAWVWWSLAMWLALVCAGWIGLTAYANLGTVPIAPESSATSDKVTGPHLDLFVHPHCPCSAATLRELSRIMTRTPAGTGCTVYFYRPQDQSDEWVQGTHWKTAQQIPRVHLAIDPAGTIAAQRGITTSGEVQVFDTLGICRFQGGITSARGHEGDSIGQTSVLAVLHGEKPLVRTSPVFGCHIQ